MVMYLCARDIDLSSFCIFSIDQARRENGHVLCARDIDLSSFYTFSIDQARRKNGHVFVCKRYRVILFLPSFLLT